jgi:hypothetical protein
MPLCDFMQTPRELPSTYMSSAQLSQFKDNLLVQVSNIVKFQDIATEPYLALGLL